MRRAFLCWAAFALFAGCDEASMEEDASVPPDAGPPDAGPVGPVQPIFDPGVLEGTGGFFDFPIPSDLRTDERGRPVLSGFPRARGLVADVIELVETERAGWSPITGVYFRFTGPLAPLPEEPEATLDEASRVILIDVDGASPERGRRLPAYVRFQRDATQFWPSNTLVVRALPGIHLHPGRRYAAVIRSGLEAADGSPVEPSPEFEALAQGGTGALAEHYAALFADLDELGIPAAEILVASAFTVSDPVAEMDLARAFIEAQPLPSVTNWQPVANRAAERTFTAEVEVYELLDGAPPYTTFGSGRIHFDADGAPARVTRRRVRVGLSVPGAAMPPPPEGYPVVLYGHGTGGDHRTHFGEEGGSLARQGIAVLGFEAALHGGRNPGGVAPEALVVSNAVAARDMVRQTVIDQMLFFRMIAAGAFEVPAEVAGGEAIRLAPSPVLYMGHSQGAQEAGVLLGVEPTLDAAFLSQGGGGGVITIMERRIGGQRIVCTIASLVSERCEDIGEDHPLMLLLVQPLLDPADPLTFAHRFVRERPADWSPLHIAMTEGTADVYTPARTVEALAAAIGLPQVAPVAQTTDPLRIAALPVVSAPVSENVELPSGARVTGGLVQWPGGSHFVIYELDDARNRYVEFLRTAAQGAPTIVGPP